MNVYVPIEEVPAVMESGVAGSVDEGLNIRLELLKINSWL